MLIVSLLGVYFVSFATLQNPPNRRRLLLGATP